MSEQDPSLLAEKHHRLLPRAQWQRTVGAVLMRELFDGVFSERVEISDGDVTRIRAKEATINGTPRILSDFWCMAYATVEHKMNQAVDVIRTESPLYRALHEPPTPLDTSLTEYTFNGSIQGNLMDAQKSIARFPLNLVRSVSSAAISAEIGEPRYQIRSFNGIADLLDSQDLRTMVDQSLVTANEFWQSFSVGYSDLSPSGLAYVHPKYTFDATSVAYSDKALRKLHSFMKRNNRHVLQDNDPHYEPRHISMKSTSGCPARHKTLNLENSGYESELQWIAGVLGTDIAYLGRAKEKNVVQQGIDFMVAILRSANDIFAPELEAYEKLLIEKQNRWGAQHAEQHAYDLVFSP